MARRPGAHKDWTKVRTIRIEDGLWQSAQRVARERGETMSDVVRRALRSYVAGDGERTDKDDE